MKYPSGLLFGEICLERVIPNIIYPESIFLFGHAHLSSAPSLFMIPKKNSMGGA
jgi:hypothetical protein